MCSLGAQPSSKGLPATQRWARLSLHCDKRDQGQRGEVPLPVSGSQNLNPSLMSKPVHLNLNRPGPQDWEMDQQRLHPGVPTGATAFALNPLWGKTPLTTTTVTRSLEPGETQPTPEKLPRRGRQAWIHRCGVGRGGPRS